MNTQTDLTKGNIFKQLTKYAAPLVLSSALQSGYGIIDMIIAGRFIGSAGLSGITNANTVVYLLTMIVFGLCNGGCILVGQYFGARDRQNCSEAASTLYAMGLFFGVIFALCLFFPAREILVLLKAPALEEGTTYLSVCALGFVFIGGYNATSAVLRAIGNSRAPLVCIIATSIVNVVLDIIFVVPLKMGVFGAALATVISQAISFLMSLYFVIISKDTLGIKVWWPKVSLKKLGAELKLGLPCAVQQSIVTISWLSVTYLFNGYGVDVSAGSGVSNKIKEFCQLFISAVSTATASMVAQNIGAGEYDRANETVKTAIKITLTIAMLMIIVVQLFAPQIVSVFTEEADTAAMAVKNIRIEIIGQLFYAVLLVHCGLMVGSGMPWYAFFNSFINCVIFRVTLSFILNHFFGLTGLFVACMISPASSVPFGMWFRRSGKWRRTLVKR